MTRCEGTQGGKVPLPLGISLYITMAICVIYYASLYI